MEILLDTHIILWSITDDPRLSYEAKELILNSENIIYYSVVSMWEVAIKYMAKKNMPLSGREFLAWCEDAGYKKLPLDDRHVCALETLEHKDGEVEHNDPFDRMLLAQAKGDGMTLLTHDSKFNSWNEPYYFIV